MCYLDMIASPFSPLFFLPAIAVLIIAMGVFLLCGVVLVIVAFIQYKQNKDKINNEKPEENNPQI